MDVRIENLGLDYIPDLQIIDYDFDNREDWLEKRAEGIGGSDVGAILGMNKYSSPLQVYKSKVEGKSKDLSDNVFIKKGKELEPVIAENYVRPYLRKLGYELITPKHIFNNKKYPHLYANIDGFAICKPDDFLPADNSKNIIIEIKWVSEYGEKGWGEDEYYGVPPSYYAQIQHYMTVMEADKAIVCALFDSDWEVKYFEVPKNETFCAKMLAETDRFYDYNILARIPPKIKASIDKEEVGIALADTTIKPFADETLDEILYQYKYAYAEAKASDKRLEELKDMAIAKYVEGSRPSSPALKMNISTYKTARFDVSRFKVENPALYNQFINETESTRTTIK